LHSWFIRDVGRTMKLRFSKECALRERAHRALARARFACRYAALAARKAWVRWATPGRDFIGIALVEHIGDIVACEPVAAHLRHEHPGAYLVWVVREPYRQLIDSNPQIDHTVAVSCVAEWVYLSKTRLFDRAMDLHLDGRSCPT